MISIDPQPKWSVQEEKNEPFCVQASEDSSFIAVGLSNGMISLRSPVTGRLSYSLQQSENRYPTTSIRFNSNDPKMFLAVSADGFIKEWTTKNPQVVWKYQEPDNQLFCLDFNQQSDKFATGGKDTKVRLYDYQSKKLITEYSRNEFDLETTRGHCNRVFSIKFNPNDTNVMYSGGWDDTVQVWDLRSSSSTRAIFGPHICGDSIDIFNNTLLTCSWRTSDQIQLWDIRNYSLLRTMKWSLMADDQQCLIYSSKFLPNGQYFIAGGSGVSQARMFSMETHTAVGTPLSLGGSIYSIFAPQTGNCAFFGLSNGFVAQHSYSTSN